MNKQPTGEPPNPYFSTPGWESIIAMLNQWGGFPSVVNQEAINSKLPLHRYTNGEPLKSEDLNHNLEVLSSAIEKLENRMVLLCDEKNLLDLNGDLIFTSSEELLKKRLGSEKPMNRYEILKNEAKK